MIILLQSELNNLNYLQQRQNEGRGISCVHTYLIYARKGDWSSAEAVVYNESDKIRNYTEVWNFLKSKYQNLN